MDEETCPCGVPLSSWWPFHRTDNHDCVRHSASECDECKAVARLIAETEEFLRKEAA